MLEKFAMENRAYDLVVHESAARRKGISDGDTVYVESFEGIREKGKVRVSQTIHPETVVSTGIAGFWAKGTPVAQGKGFDFNKFLFVSPEKLDFGNGAFDSCVKVKMWRAEE
jgi:anaerobic selenocysteine-containing dehydrogenase